MREVVFDTETTGLEHLRGDRLIEIGCVELLNQIPTGRTFHRYVNPRRLVNPDAVAVHGLTDAFLAAHPYFEVVCAEFIDFIGDSPLVAHNAAFDRGFINMELTLCQQMALAEHRFIDTLVLARRRHPNGPNSLDALCARYGIDNSGRSKHGALLDAEILAEVYLELLGGRQASFALGNATRMIVVSSHSATQVRLRPSLLPSRLSATERAAHRDYIEAMNTVAVWSRYWDPQSAA